MQSNISSSTRIGSITARLRQAILAGDIKPGVRLTETALANEMGVSRTPVVASLKALTEQGLVRYAPNRGYWVRELTAAELLQGYEVLATLEGMTARLVAERGLSPADIQELQVCVDEARRLEVGGEFVPEDLERYGDIDARFHKVLLDNCGNSQLVEFIRRAYEVPTLFWHRTSNWRSRETVRRSREFHERILDAIKSRQSERAEFWMREHVSEAGRLLCKSMEP